MSTVLITGGAKRIGRSIALHLADAGFDIALHYNSSENDAMKTSEEIRTKGVKCKLFVADLSSEDEVLDLIPNTIKEFSDLNLLINNASIFEPSSIKETSIELLNRHLSINLKAPYILTQRFSKHCKSGQIINILDTRINSDRTKYAAYSISKKALSDLTKMSAIELAPSIRVNAIAPGLILPPEGKDEYYLADLAKDIPLKKSGSINHILASLTFLMNNDYMTGQTIFCDGGEHLVK